MFCTWCCTLRVMNVFSGFVCVCCSVWAIIQVAVKYLAQGLHNKTAASWHDTCQEREEKGWGKRFWNKASPFSPLRLPVISRLPHVFPYLPSHLYCWVQSNIWGRECLFLWCQVLLCILCLMECEKLQIDRTEGIMHMNTASSCASLRAHTTVLFTRVNSLEVEAVLSQLHSGMAHLSCLSPDYVFCLCGVSSVCFTSQLMHITWNNMIGRSRCVLHFSPIFICCRNL